MTTKGCFFSGGGSSMCRFGCSLFMTGMGAGGVGAKGIGRLGGVLFTTAKGSGAGAGGGSDKAMGRFGGILFMTGEAGGADAGGSVKDMAFLAAGLGLARTGHLAGRGWECVWTGAWTGACNPLISAMKAAQL